MKRYAKTKDIRVGVIGYGGAFNMGYAHLAEMCQAGMTPAAVCDPDTARLEVAQKDYPGIETYTTVTDMLAKSDVDLLVIITPHNTHAQIALQCLKAGRHVVCEKPMAITTKECDAMIAAAKKSKAMLSVYHNRHWDGCILQAVKTIRSGAIGDVVRVQAHMTGYAKPGEWWRSSKSISGGILYDWGVHLLEYTLQIVNSDMSEVSGFAKKGFWGPQTSWKNDCNEDEGFAVVRFTNGAYATLTISTIDARPNPFWLEVTGTKGAYAFHGLHWELATVENGERVVRTAQSPASEGIKYYQNIAAHLTKATPLVITPEWARRPIHVLDLACQSAEKGKTLPVKYR